jgi:hypothetical protein
MYVHASPTLIARNEAEHTTRSCESVVGLAAAAGVDASAKQQRSMEEAALAYGTRACSSGEFLPPL